MKTGKLIVLAVVLAAAIGIIVLVNALKNKTPSEESLSFFPGMSEKSIGAVLLKDPQDMVKLQRKGDVWILLPKTGILSAAATTRPEPSGLAGAMRSQPAVTGAANPTAGPAVAVNGELPADSACMAQLLDAIPKLRKSTVVSENQAKQAMFEVDSAHGGFIEVFDLAGKSAGTVIMGKSGPDYGTSYFRSAGSNAVYLVPESNRFAFSADHQRWSDKSIMKFDKATVKQIAIAKKAAPKAEPKAQPPIVLARGDSVVKGWEFLSPAKKAVDSNKVVALINDLSSLNAAAYEDSTLADSVTGLADPTIILTIAFKSGTNRTVAIGNEKIGQSKYWIKIPEKPYVYLISDYQYKQFDKKADDFTIEPSKPQEKPGAPKLMPPSSLGKIKRSMGN